MTCQFWPPMTKLGKGVTEGKSDTRVEVSLGSSVASTTSCSPQIGPGSQGYPRPSLFLSSTHSFCRLVAQISVTAITHISFLSLFPGTSCPFAPAFALLDVLRLRFSPPPPSWLPPAAPDTRQPSITTNFPSPPRNSTQKTYNRPIPLRLQHTKRRHVCKSKPWNQQPRRRSTTLLSSTWGPT